MAPLFPCYNNYYGNVVISIANVVHSFGDDDNATTTTTHEEPPPFVKMCLGTQAFDDVDGDTTHDVVLFLGAHVSIKKKEKQKIERKGASVTLVGSSSLFLCYFFFFFLNTLRSRPFYGSIPKGILNFPTQQYTQNKILTCHMTFKQSFPKTTSSICKTRMKSNV